MELEEGSQSLLEENKKLSEELAQCKVCSRTKINYAEGCEKLSFIVIIKMLYNQAARQTAVVCTVESSFMITGKLLVKK